MVSVSDVEQRNDGNAGIDTGSHYQDKCSQMQLAACERQNKAHELEGKQVHGDPTMLKTSKVAVLSRACLLWCIGVVLLLPSCAVQLVEMDRMCLMGVDELRDRGLRADDAKFDRLNFNWSVRAGRKIDLESGTCTDCPIHLSYFIDGSIVKVDIPYASLDDRARLVDLRRIGDQALDALREGGYEPADLTLCVVGYICGSWTPPGAPQGHRERRRRQCAELKLTYRIDASKEYVEDGPDRKWQWQTVTVKLPVSGNRNRTTLAEGYYTRMIR